jgi:hypothetical protein
VIPPSGIAPSLPFPSGRVSSHISAGWLNVICNGVGSFSLEFEHEANSSVVTAIPKIIFVSDIIVEVL